jgi:uncharacterized Zn-finger protein
MQYHQNLHSAIKPFNCDHCGKGYPGKPYLISHLKSHLPDKPFKCVICGNGFKRNYDLKVHINSQHINPKPRKKRVSKKGLKKINKTEPAKDETVH